MIGCKTQVAFVVIGQFRSVGRSLGRSVRFVDSVDVVNKSCVGCW